MATLPEPFKIKMVENIHLPPKEKREAVIKEAGYNVFNLKIEDIFIDLLTDSGTSAMSDNQWSGMFKTHQAYAGTDSYYNLEKAVKDLWGMKYFMPAHQGRATENIFFKALLKDKGGTIPSNMHFDTTEANIIQKGGTPVNLVVDEAYESTIELPFKGNIDIEKLKAFVEETGPENIPAIMLTITCNTGAGQPVSMENIKQTKEVADKHNLSLFLDACRYAENAYFIKLREDGYKDKTVKEIAKEMFSYADGCTFSGKKEALTNIGGILAMNDEKLYIDCINELTIVEGYKTYGGLACRELEAMARGMYEAIDDSYQEYRINQVKFLGDKLDEAGVPLFKPLGGHAVYVDAKRFLPTVPPEQFPAQALTAELYAGSGIRAVELGSSAFGKTDPETGEFIPHSMECMRLAIPRRVYTNNHLQYVADAIIDLYKKRDSIKGLRRTYAPELLGHFNAHFEPID